MYFYLQLTFFNLFLYLQFIILALIISILITFFLRIPMFLLIIYIHFNIYLLIV